MVNKENSINYLNSNRKIKCAHFYCLKKFNITVILAKYSHNLWLTLCYIHLILLSVQKEDNLLHEAIIYEATMHEL